MRTSTLRFLSVGLLIGTIVGCGKEGPGGTQGLCEKLADCGSTTPVADCVNSLSSCPNAESQADSCLENDDCGQVGACFLQFALTCTPNPGTSGATEVETESMGTNPTESSMGTTADTVEPTETSSPATSMTTDVDPDTTSPSGTDTTDPGTTDPSTTGGGPASFGPCDMMTPCPNGEDCLGVMGVEGTFCSPACDEQGAACDGYEGSGMALCLLSTDMMPATNCVVICQTDADCDPGMTCKEVPMQMQPVSICTSP